MASIRVPEASDDGSRPGSNGTFALLCAAALLGTLFAGTALLWWHYGSVVFAEIALAALAMCF